MTETTEVGIKETKEAMVGVFTVACLLVERFKDGVGVDDGIAIWDKIKNDEAFKAKIVAAYEGYGLIPSEVKDIDVTEGFELMGAMMPEILKLIKSFKKI